MPFKSGCLKVRHYYDFEDRQKCGKPVHIRGRWLFANGAQSNINGIAPNGFEYQFTDPPSDELARLKLKIEFLEFQLEEETRNFNDLRASLLLVGEAQNRYATHTGSDESAVADLKKGKDRIVKLREKIKPLVERHDELFAQTPEEIKRRETEAIMEKHRRIVSARQEKVRKEAQAIKI